MCKVKQSNYYRDILVNKTYYKLKKENVMFVVYFTECLRNKVQYIMRGHDDLKLSTKYSEPHDNFCILDMDNFEAITRLIENNPKTLLGIKRCYNQNIFTLDPEYVEYVEEKSEGKDRDKETVWCLVEFEKHLKWQNTSEY